MKWKKLVKALMKNKFCINCTYGDSTPAMHDVVGLGPKCCYDNECEESHDY